MRLTDAVQKTKRKCLHDCVAVFRFLVLAARRAVRRAAHRAARPVVQAVLALFHPAPAAPVVHHRHPRRQGQRDHAAANVFTLGMDLCG